MFLIKLKLGKIWSSLKIILLNRGMEGRTILKFDIILLQLKDILVGLPIRIMFILRRGLEVGVQRSQP